MVGGKRGKGIKREDEKRGNNETVKCKKGWGN